MATNEIPANAHSIPLHLAVEMTKRYRENREEILGNQFKARNILPLSETFNKEAFTSLLNNPEVKALRIYYGMSEDLNIHAIVVGANDQNEDILPSENLDAEGDGPVIVEEAQRCPPLCPPDSSLNTP